MSRDRHRQTLESLRLARTSRDGSEAAYGVELRTLTEKLCEALGAPAEARDEALKVAYSGGISHKKAQEAQKDLVNFVPFCG